ncbi:protein Wnt-16 [Gadus morhua]|uniref:protein Wnt-16 n=1 Tax=Gadus morhua TaxID=8049 RepID=UPI0011B5D9E5|nr:protein Wnt-16 [Gadus morhua]
MERVHHTCTLHLLLLTVFPLCCQASWMWLGLSSAGVAEQRGCSDLPFSREQKELCRKRPFLLPAVQAGARLGLAECQSQFKHERWNCTSKDFSVFGYELTSGTKESAFIHAVMAAGLVHAITRACSQGAIAECGCDASLQSLGSPLEGWHWGGCSDHTRFATWFSRQFLDGPPGNTSLPRATSPALLAVNQHNTDAGRQAVERTMVTDCRCHGVSGSCAVKTCWRSLAPFVRVGAVLKERFENSVEVLQRFARQKVRRKDKVSRRVPLERDRLLYLHKSPNYCLEDPGRGSLGTRGRTCSRTSRGADGCGLLCCGRGYNTRVVRHVTRCACKFVWCCYVRCRRCESVTDIHTCK